MKQETKVKLIRYGVCFAIAILISVSVFAAKGFFGDSVAVNIQILADGFFVSGILMTLFAGMLFVSGEGGLIGISFVMRNVILAFIPMGRQKHEFYADYRERKLKSMKKSQDHCVLVVGLLFLIVGIVFNVIWYVNFYNPGSLN